MSRLERLRRLRKEEVGWRTRAFARIQRDRVVNAVHPPRWDRRAIGAALAADHVDPFMRTHVARHDWMAAQRWLTRRFSERRSRFVLDPAHAGDLRAALLRQWPDADRQAADAAAGLLDGRFNLLGYRNLSFRTAARPIDWQFDPIHRRRPPQRFWADVPYLDPACGDHKVIWELNRHQHWLALGRALWLTRDRQYGVAIVNQLTDWLEANPPLQGINWASSLEIGFRSISWVWALHFLLADAETGTSAFDTQPWLVDLLVGLDRQLTHLEQNLSYYFSPNTHLTGEALALYVAGSAIPELAGSARWAATGRRILLHEIDTQIGRDGGHAERSMHYHRYTLDFYLFALLIAERCNDGEAAAAFRDASARLASFARGMADDRGHLAMIGDDDGGMLWPLTGRDPVDVRDSLAVAAAVLQRPELMAWDLPEETAWLAGPAPLASAFVTATADRPSHLAPSHLFPDTGYAVINGADGDHLTFDVGPHGFLNGGHAHADALGITLTLNHLPLLIDPGTATYTMDPLLRDRMRDAASHNTMTLDGVSPSRPSGPFHWRSRTDARLDAWRSNAAFAWAEAALEGATPLRHRRSIVHGTQGGWLIVDEVLGRGRHVADVFWQFDPQWMITCDSKHRLRARHVDGHLAWLLHDEGGLSLVHGDEDSGRGWCSPCYGTLVPTWSACVTRHVAAPAALLTWIGAGGDATRPPLLERLALAHDPGGAAVAARVAHDDLVTTTVVRPGEAPARETRSCATPALHSDGRLIQYTVRDGSLVALALADATRALALQPGLLSVASDSRVADLALTIDAEAIDLYASAPPSRLTLQGTAAARVRTLRLNGREQPMTRERRVDGIVIPAAAWGAQEPEMRATCVA